MNLKLSQAKLLIFFALTIPINIVSCKPDVKQTWLYDDNDDRGFTETLNGNVKQVTIGDTTTNDFYNAHFDGEGNMKMVVTKHTSIITTGNKSDTTIGADTAVYTVKYDESAKRKVITRFFSSISRPYKKDSITDIYRDTLSCEFDKKGQLNCRALRPGIITTIKDETIYDNAGNLIKLKRHFLYAHREPDIFEFKYDSQHRRLEVKLLDEQFGVLIKTDYKYIEHDTHNNWIKKVVHIQNYPPMAKYSKTDTLTRKITYY